MRNIKAPNLKRLLDLCVALPMLLACGPLIVTCAVLIAVCDRHSPFFGAIRMRTMDEPFTMWKLRTMRGVDDGLPTGGSKVHLMTALGRFLRRWRLDELPQLWNVLIGDMSLVGPRPPTRLMVRNFPELFSQTLKSPPGITGLGTIKYTHREARVLGSARTSAEVERVYRRDILPKKMRLDRFYADRQSVGCDLWILWQTARVILALNVAADRARVAGLCRNCGTIDLRSEHSDARISRLFIRRPLDRVKVVKPLAARHNSDKSYPIGRGLEHW
ncbi:sugar transferase [Marivita sp. S2033]|uniref:sugar transferase n=1 Tax=Marivita sp. S2033 TaxID=3373187 RepID=UPI0039823F9A